MTATLTVKRLELIRELIPQNSTVGFLVNPDNQDLLQEIEDIARSTGRLCVPKTQSKLMTWRNHLSWRNDRAPVFRRGRLGLAIQVEDPA